MSKLITARMIRSKGSCYNPTDLDGIDSKTKWTLLEWMNYKHYKDGTADAIWVFSKMTDERMARRFAIWCAKRCKTDVAEIKDYLKVIEGHYLNGTHTAAEMRAADSAAYWAASASASAYWAASAAAYWAAAAAADMATYWAVSAAASVSAAAAADMATYWAADSAADSAKEQKAQLAKIKRMLTTSEGVDK